MSLLDTGVSLPNPRPSLRTQGVERRHLLSVENVKMREAGGSSNQKITVDVKDDDDEVQILSPRSVAQVILFLVLCKFFVTLWYYAFLCALTQRM